MCSDKEKVEVTQISELMYSFNFLQLRLLEQVALLSVVSC